DACGEVRDGVAGRGRIDLRVERGDLYRDIYFWKQRAAIAVDLLDIFPSLRGGSQLVDQLEITLPVLIGFLFAQHRFAEDVGRECEPAAAHFFQLGDRRFSIAGEDEVIRHLADTQAGGEPKERRRFAAQTKAGAYDPRKLTIERA